MAHDQDANLRKNLEHLEHKVALLQNRVTMLEEENREFAELLKGKGIDVRRQVSGALEVPPPLSEPDPGNAEMLAQMRAAERRIYDEICGKDQVFLVLRSPTKVDVGSFLRKSRVWLCAAASDLVLFAAGHKPLLLRIPYAHLQQSLYNQVTGELVLAPDRKYPLSHVELSPVQGYQLLAQIFHGKATS